MKISNSIMFSLILLCVFVSCSGQPGGNSSGREQRLAEDITVTEISEDVFVVTHSFPWPGNSLLVKTGKNNFVWADTPYTPQATAVVLDWLHGRFGKDLDIVEINTGFHIDNLGGNEELIKRKIKVYGSDRTCELLKTRSSATMDKMCGWLGGAENKKYLDIYGNFVFAAPDTVFDIEREQTIRSGDSIALVFFPGVTHTADNLVVYFPDKKLLFGGCMVLAAAAQKAGYVEDGDISLWPESLRRVEERFPDMKIVVPGHGNVGGRELIGHTVEILIGASR